MPLLITQAEIEALPSDPRQRFVAIEEICRKRYEDSIGGDEIPWVYVQDMRLQYMGAVVGAAKYLEIEPICRISIPRKSQWNDDAYEDFKNELHFYTIQLALEGADRNSYTSIILLGSTRVRLKTLTSHLIDHIQKLDLPAHRIDRLLEKIRKFDQELDGRRLTFVHVAVLALGVAGAIADLDGAANVVRSLLTQLEESIGLAHEEQCQQAAALAAVPEMKKLEPPRPTSPTLRASSEIFPTDVEDEIPF